MRTASFVPCIWLEKPAAGSAFSTVTDLIHCERPKYEQMGILFAHARDETNILCSAPFVIFERAAAGF